VAAWLSGGLKHSGRSEAFYKVIPKWTPKRCKESENRIVLEPANNRNAGTVRKKGQLEITQKVMYEGKAIRSTETERSKGGSEYGTGKGQFPERKTRNLYLRRLATMEQVSTIKRAKDRSSAIS
jgi:hypothetical protein